MTATERIAWLGQDTSDDESGLLLFADAILDQWKTSGGPVDPALYERHSLNCGIFIPTLYHGKNTPNVDPLVDHLGPNDGTAGLEIATGTDKSIRLYTDGPNANVDAAAFVQLGGSLRRGVIPVSYRIIGGAKFLKKEGA
jgi:hypothetical protein